MKAFKKTSPRSSISAMTLVEVIIAMTIGVGVIGAATWFLMEGTRASYRAMADTENSIQQWGLSAKLQIDGKVANGVTIFASLNEEPEADYLRVIPVDNGIYEDGLERGNVLVLTKIQLNEGVSTNVVTDMIVYIYTPGDAPNHGTLKRSPATGTFHEEFKAVDASKNPLSTKEIVHENLLAILERAEVVQDHVIALSVKGPFGRFGNINNVSIALVREEATTGKIKSSNLTEVSFNLR